MDVEFTYGVPVIMLDIMKAFTGHDFLEDIQKAISPPQIIERLNPDKFEFAKYRDGLTEEMQDTVWMVFDRLGELDLKQVAYKENKKRYMEEMRIKDESEMDKLIKEGKDQAAIILYLQ